MSYKLADVIWNDDGTMATELTPLEALEKLKQNNKDNTHLFDDELLDIIETALKDYERVMVEKNDLFKRWTKEHQALEIIKEKKVNVNQFLKHCSPKNKWGYNKTICDENRQLTQEEYNLLKEVLL